MSSSDQRPDGGPDWYIGNEWDAEGDEFLVPAAVWGMVCGDVGGLVNYLTSSRCEMDPMVRTMLVQVLSDKTNHDFHLKFERAAHVPKGRFLTIGENIQIWRRNRFIANDLINAGMLERGNQANAIYTIANQVNLTEETIKKVWKSARREAVHSYWFVSWCNENSIEFKSKSAKEIEKIEKSIPRNFKPKTPKNYIECYIDDRAPDERWRESVFGTSNTF